MSAPEDRPVDAADLRRTSRSLRGARGALLELPARRIATTLGRVGERFLDPDDPVRREALATLPSESGLSPQMCELVLDGMAADWTADRLRELLARELDDGVPLDGLFTLPDGRRLRAFGPDLCVQISSGTVPGVGVTALLRSLLVKSPTLLKPGAGDRTLPTLFARALHEAGGPVAAALAVRYWKGGEADLGAAAVEDAEVVVVYGGDEAVRAVRDILPAPTRLVAYHHRVSFGAVGRGVLEPGRAEEVAGDLARAAATFDQRGCVCPGVVFVEAGGAVEVESFAGLLAERLAGVEADLPTGRLAPGELSRVHQLRGTAELRAAAAAQESAGSAGGDGGTGGSVEGAAGARLVRHGGGAPWTVLVDPDATVASPCVGRTVRLRPVRSLDEVAALVAPAARYLQTASVAAVPERLPGLADDLGRAGVTRLTPFREAAFPPPWWTHDGRGPLDVLLRWVELDAG